MASWRCDRAGDPLPSYYRASSCDRTCPCLPSPTERKRQSDLHDFSVQAGEFHRVFCYLLRSTTATLFTPLHARYNRRSGVATMLRTTPPPDGIAFLLKLSDVGSNLTSVFGFTPDSLYQTSPSFAIAIPYGSESFAPGEIHRRQCQASRPSSADFACRPGNLLRYTRSHAISGVPNNCCACSAHLPYLSAR